MFDIHLVVSDDINEILLDGLKNSFSFDIEIESSDGVIVLYALGVLCFGVLHYTYQEKISSESCDYNTHIVTDKVVSEELFFYDVFFWFLLFVSLALILDIVTPVSNLYFTLWASFVYTSFLFHACNIADIGKYARSVSIAAWTIHAFILTVSTNTSIMNGSCILFFHVASVIFYYVNIMETVVYTKFVHVRLWACIVYNACVVLVYINNIHQMIADT